jgi:TolB protein
MKAVPRVLKPYQTCQVWIFDTDTNQSTLLLETASILLEAPNWTMDNDLILNGAGTLWRLAVDGGPLEPIVIEGLPPLNNDHVLDPDGTHIFMSAYDDWQIYRAPVKGGVATKVTGKENPDALLHFLHGVSPDGGQLAFVGIRLDETSETFKLLTAEIYTVGADGTGYRQITNQNVPNDGPEYSPDGKWLYFNTEQFSGHAQIARMRTDGSEQTRLTNTTTVDWFPHLSPDGSKAVYLAYPSGTEGHPQDLNVELMLVQNDNWDKATRAASLFGGQGTINVNSWSPDSRRFAYVAYPISK